MRRDAAVGQKPAETLPMALDLSLIHLRFRKPEVVLLLRCHGGTPVTCDGLQSFRICFLVSFDL